MANYVCVAPGEVADTPGPHVDYKHVGSNDDVITFPHVDSCTAIGLLWADGIIAGGHVPWEWGDTFDVNQNAKRMIDEMLIDVAQKRWESGPDDSAVSAFSLLVMFGDQQVFPVIKLELATRLAVPVPNVLEWWNQLPSGGDVRFSAKQVSVSDSVTKMPVGSYNFPFVGLKNKVSYDRSPLFRTARGTVGLKGLLEQTGDAPPAPADLERVFDGAFLDHYPGNRGKLVEWFLYVRKKLGRPTTIDAPVSNTMQGKVTYHFKGNMKLVVNLELSEVNQVKRITKFASQITGPPRF